MVWATALFVAALLVSNVAATTDCVVCVLGLALVQQLSHNFSAFSSPTFFSQM